VGWVSGDLVLRRVSEGRAGAEAGDDYDVIGADGLVIGRIFRATMAGWVWRLTYGEREDQGHERTLAAAMQALSRSLDRE
jgi:hypothetical protein